MPDRANRQFTLTLEPVTGCNLRCRYCYTNNSSAHVMDRDTLTLTLRKGIEYALAEGFDEIHILWHGGEPLLAGIDFFQYALNIARELDDDAVCRHFIQTNGLLVNDAYCRLFRRHNVEVGLSLDGPADLHDHMRKSHQGNGTHAEVIESLNRLERNDLKPGFCVVASRIGLGDEDRIYQFFRNLGYGFGVNPMIPPFADPTSRKYLFRAGEYGHFLCRLFDIWTATETNRVNVAPLDVFIRSLLTGETALCQQQSSCVGLSLCVKADGRVLLCNRSQQPVLGNIAEHSVADIFQTTFCRKLQQREKQLSTCRSCRERPICHGGCPQLAMDINGTWTAPDPFCRDYRTIWGHMRRQGIGSRFKRAV